MSQRKNYFISKDMQSRFAGTILLLTFLVAVITACNIYVLGSYFVSTNATAGQDQLLTEVLKGFAAEYWPRLLVLVFVNVVIVFIVSVMYSHQTAGPAYKLEQSIKRIVDGDLTFEVSLRHNDNLKELAVALNNMLKKFRTTLTKAKNLAEDVSLKLDNYEKDDKFKLLAHNAKELRDLIEQFKLDGVEGESIVADDDEKTEATPA